MVTIDGLTIQEGMVPTSGVRLHYSEVGTGAPLVWLHGSGAGASGMSNFGGNLPAFTDFRNVVFDFPRFGKSDKPEFPGPPVEYCADRIVEALQELGVGRANLVGNSFGAAVALLVAAKHPESVERLVLMGAGGSGGVQTQAQVSEGMRLVRAYFDTASPTREQLRELLTMMVFDPSLVTEELLDERYAASLAAHPELPPMKPSDLSSLLVDIVAPTLMLWGRDDRVIPVDRSLRLVQGIRDSMLVVIPRCGHWVQVEQRELFNRFVREFLEGVL